MRPQSKSIKQYQIISLPKDKRPQLLCSQMEAVQNELGVWGSRCLDIKE